MSASSESLKEETHHHHVHFDRASLKDDFESENFVTYQRTDDGITVNLGFLQINHKYAIDLKLPSKYFDEFTKLDDSNSFIPDVSSDVPNLNCHVIDFCGKPTTSSDGYYEMKIDFFAYKEKLLKEAIKIVNAKNSEEILKLIIIARVLGKGKGTPMLRNGIHCTGAVKDDESESSDFSTTGK
ncbi:UPF0687 protein C20orf27 homolog [Condylostylus longicornis]|uniref:UPF0687 protein C20orf27 homolog n=1 Tax=Condylostylus longicornis TaxID=2530218 RepID=UPI00244DC2C1|nr:UPF0687 protein C20orf27 homolog [Condylostylus longicornis]